MTPLLSICIATLNRGGFIGETLDSIIAQATPEVEIVVVDGASTDNTPEVVRDRQRHFSGLNYVRLPEKGGVDRDYDRTVQAAQGEYCWLMSDDDILKPGAIAAVLAVLRDAYCLVIVNAEVRSADFSDLIVPRKLPLEENRIYKPSDQPALLIDVATFMTFIGCVVIKREVWNARERERYFGTEFIHVGTVFQCRLPADALVLAQPWIAIRAGNASWSSKYFEIWMIKWPSLIWSFAGYSDRVKRQVCPHEPWRWWKMLAIARAKGVFSDREYQRFVRPREASARERLAARLIACLPGVAVNLLVLLYFSTRRSRDLYGIYELRTSPFYIGNYCSRFLGRGVRK